MQISPEARREHQRFQQDLHYYCRKALRVKLKTGGYAPFVWNKAQQYLHQRVEAQKQRTGRVRMVILKGRQQGMSTYIAARGFRFTTGNIGIRAYILSHHSSTTGTLFGIVDKYYKTCPDQLKPKLLLDNNRQMQFDNDSQYTVGTAGTGAGGRGDTNQFFHWSEVAFSENIEELLAGAYQTVADSDNTEKFLESTANGVGNFFYNMCMDALRGDGEYELVFIPWYWQEEYATKPPANFKATDDEEKLRVQIDPEGKRWILTDAQLNWRRNKIRELEQSKKGNGLRLFKQEYPFSIKEAFQFSGSSLFDPDAVAQAKVSRLEDKYAPLILGVDPAPLNDRTTITWRRGRHWIKTEYFVGVNQMELSGKLAVRIDRHGVDKVFIDVGEGRGAVSRLHELGYDDIVIGIPFAQRPIDEDIYANKRAEMYGQAKDWLEDEIGCRIPNNAASDNLMSGDELEVELGIIPEFKTTSNGRRQLPSKAEIKKEYGQSPDGVDSFVLTFAQPVRTEYTGRRKMKKQTRSTRSELSVMNKRRAKPTTQYDDWDDDDGTVRRNRPGLRRHGR